MCTCKSPGLRIRKRMALGSRLGHSLGRWGRWGGRRRWPGQRQTQRSWRTLWKVWGVGVGWLVSGSDQTDAWKKCLHAIYTNLCFCAWRIAKTQNTRRLSCTFVKFWISRPFQAIWNESWTEIEVQLVSDYSRPLTQQLHLYVVECIFYDEIVNCKKNIFTHFTLRKK